MRALRWIHRNYEMAVTAYAVMAALTLAVVTALVWGR